MVNTEFYTTPDGAVMYKQMNEEVKVLKMEDRAVVQELLDMIRNRYPKAFEALSKLYTKSELNRSLYEYSIVSRFIRCNFGEYDMNTTDIDADGFFRFEEVNCPLRGECQYEGCICKPEIDTKLTTREYEVLQHIAAGNDSNTIAEELNISPATVNRHRENIKAKLNVRTIAQLVAYYYKNVQKNE